MTVFQRKIESVEVAAVASLSALRLFALACSTLVKNACAIVLLLLGALFALGEAETEIGNSEVVTLDSRKVSSLLKRFRIF